jgi:peptide/nickel transport system substrate-binding protein
MWRRRTVLTSASAAIAAAVLPSDRVAAAPEKVLRVAMTVADIPLTSGQPSQGGEGQRFIGYQLYDALINWDLSQRDVLAKLRPGLALSWSVDDATHTIWTFKLRPGVKFHDGSPFNADAVVFNFDKLSNKDSPQFDPAQAAQGATYVAPIKSYRKVDDLTVELTAKRADAVIPYQIANIYMSGPANWEKLGRDWNKVALQPSGTGPWMMDKLVPRTRAELVRNPNYWDPARIPKSDRQILLPVPDANTRVAALLSGQVDWAEAPPPDTIDRLKASGMQIVTNKYPHIWPYILSFGEGSPMRDIRVRKALNLGIDRDGVVQLLGGSAMPAKGMVYPGHPWFGTPSFDLKYDPDQARKLLAEAGYGPNKPLTVTFAISTAGSGQMQPGPMNDLVQQNLQEVGVQVNFQVMEWEALRARRRAGAAAPENKGVDGLNNSWAFYDPDIGLINTSWSLMGPPAGFNWGGYNDKVADDLCQKAKLAFTPDEQDKILAQLHTYLVDQAMWIWVVHDLNPRALGPKVQGYVEAQSWFQDLTPVHVG